MIWRVSLIFLVTSLGTAPSIAESVVAQRTIRSHAIISSADLKMIDDQIPNAYSNIDDVIGMEARNVIFAGHPINLDNIGPPALVERNQIVPLVYLQGGLMIATEGRALGRGGVGDIIRVMNLSSRNTISGTISADGSIRTGGPNMSRFR